MKSLVEKLLAMDADMKRLKVLAIRTTGEHGISVQVEGFKDVPNMVGTLYKRRDSEYLQYEKACMIDGIEICAVGTKAEMKKDFAEEEK